MGRALSPALRRLIRKTRESRGMSLRELARRTQLSPTYLSQVETGKTGSPTASRLAAIARELELDVDELCAQAGCVARDVLFAIGNRPRLMAALVREASHLTAADVLRLINTARDLGSQR